MATAIKTIKNHLTDDTIYPITTANAVFLANSTVDTVEGVLGNTDISSIGDGTITGAIDALNDSKVSKSGDTMTASLNIDRADGAVSRLFLKSNRATPGSTYSGDMQIGEVNIQSLEDTSDPIGYFRGNILASGISSMEVICRKTVNGASVFNTLALKVSPTGERSVSISEAAPWLTALGLNNLIKAVEYTYTYSIAANSSLAVTSTNLSFSTPSGYTPIGVTMFNSANDNVMIRGFNPRATSGNCLWLRNLSSSTQTGTARVGVLYIKTAVV